MVSFLIAGGQRNLRTRTNNYQSCWTSKKVKFPTRCVCDARTRVLRGKNKTMTNEMETSGLCSPKISYAQVP